MTASLLQILPDLQRALSEGFAEIDQEEQEKQGNEAHTIITAANDDASVTFDPDAVKDTLAFFDHSHKAKSDIVKPHFWQKLPFLGNGARTNLTSARQEPTLIGHSQETMQASDAQNITTNSNAFDPDLLDPGQISHASDHDRKANVFTLMRQAKAEQSLAQKQATAMSRLMTLSEDEADNDDDYQSQSQSQTKPPLTLTGLLLRLAALVVILAALIGERDIIVRTVPSLAPLYRFIGLPVAPHGVSLNAITSSLEHEQNQTVLIVEGDLKNMRASEISVPQIRVDVRDNTGRSIYYWTLYPQKRKLGAHELEHFKSRLASPPPEGVDVAVSFVQH